MAKISIWKLWFIVGTSVFCFFLGAASVMAEPIAQPCKMNKAGIKAIKRGGQNPAKVYEETLKNIPTKASWHLPVYPGAEFASRMKGNDSMFPSINLISEDPPEKVRAWYKEQLKGWTFDDMYKIFHENDGKLDTSKMFTTQTVNVMEETGEGIDLMFFEIPDVKTRIQILYNPTKLN